MKKRPTLVFSIEDVIELNDRIIGYFGFDLGCQSLDIEEAKHIAEVISEIVNGKKRRRFIYSKYPEGNSLSF